MISVGVQSLMVSGWQNHSIPGTIYIHSYIIKDFSRNCRSPVAFRNNMVSMLPILLLHTKNRSNTLRQ